MEELIASKYEDILNRRRALCMEILTSEKDLEDMFERNNFYKKKTKENKRGLHS